MSGLIAMELQVRPNQAQTAYEDGRFVQECFNLPSTAELQMVV